MAQIACSHYPAVAVATAGDLRRRHGEGRNVMPRIEGDPAERGYAEVGRKGRGGKKTVDGGAPLRFNRLGRRFASPEFEFFGNNFALTYRPRSGGL